MGKSLGVGTGRAVSVLGERAERTDGPRQSRSTPALWNPSPLRLWPFTEGVQIRLPAAMRESEREKMPEEQKELLDYH